MLRAIAGLPDGHPGHVARQVHRLREQVAQEIHACTLIRPRLWLNPRVRGKGKTQLLFNDNRFSSVQGLTIAIPVKRRRALLASNPIEESPARNSSRMRRVRVRYFYTDFPKKLVLTHHIRKEHRSQAAVTRGSKMNVIVLGKSSLHPIAH